jgi:hypothetical protein
MPPAVRTRGSEVRACSGEEGIRADAYKFEATFHLRASRLSAMTPGSVWPKAPIGPVKVVRRPSAAASDTAPTESGLQCNYAAW